MQTRRPIYPRIDIGVGFVTRCQLISSSCPPWNIIVLSKLPPRFDRKAPQPSIVPAHCVARQKLREPGQKESGGTKKSKRTKRLEITGIVYVRLGNDLSYPVKECLGPLNPATAVRPVTIFTANYNCSLRSLCSPFN